MVEIAFWVLLLKYFRMLSSGGGRARHRVCCRKPLEMVSGWPDTRARGWPAAGDKLSLYKRRDGADVTRQCDMCITAAAAAALLTNCPIVLAKKDSLETGQASRQQGLGSPRAQKAGLKSPCERGFSGGKNWIDNMESAEKESEKTWK